MKEFETRSSIFSSIIIFLAIIVFIGGIVLGNMYKTVHLKDDYQDPSLTLKDYMYEEEFNSQLMFSCWGVDILFTTFMALVNSILKTLEEIRDTNIKSNKELIKTNEEENNIKVCDEKENDEKLENIIKQYSKN